MSYSMILILWIFPNSSLFMGSREYFLITFWSKLTWVFFKAIAVIQVQATSNVGVWLHTTLFKL